ncbi:MAG: hypothetical protein WC330_04120 [Candidatus Omnitrophota bacterium]|jgi:hypothetical protein
MRKWLIVFLFLFIPFTLLSQEQKSTKQKSSIPDNEQLGVATSGLPLVSTGFNLEKQLNFGKEVLKNGGFLDGLQIYKVVRSENTASCATQQCKAVAPTLLSIRYAGEGRCQDIKDSSMQQVCSAVDSNKCDLLTGGKKNFCQSLLNGDVGNLAKSSQDFEVAKSLGFPIGTGEASLILGIYNGFKRYSAIACERYANSAKLSLSRKLACKIIFAQNPDTEINALTNDLSLFFVSRQHSMPELCDSIVDGSVRSVCKNDKVKELINAW